MGVVYENAETQGENFLDSCSEIIYTYEKNRKCKEKK